MTGRMHITLKTKLASTLLALGDIDYEHAKLMADGDIISLYHWDHNILHAIEPGNDHFSNLKPMLIAAHRQKSKTDAGIIAKSKRIRAREAEHKLLMLPPSEEQQIRERVRRWVAQRVAQIPSRPFPKGKRKMRGRP